MLCWLKLGMNYWHCCTQFSNKSMSDYSILLVVYPTVWRHWWRTWQRHLVRVFTATAERLLYGQHSPYLRRHRPRPRLATDTHRIPSHRSRSKPDQEMSWTASTLRQVRRVRASRQRLVGRRQLQRFRKSASTRLLSRRPDGHRRCDDYLRFK